MSPGLLTQQEFAEAMRQNPEVQNHARLMTESNRRPYQIRQAQKKAWGEVKRARAQFLKASLRFDRVLKSATKTNKAMAEWEREDRELRERLIRLCESARNKASDKELETVKKIRNNLAHTFQEQAERVPILRHVLSRSRSRPPTQLGNSGSASASPPRP